jgi:hypothetical protein
MGVRAFGFRPLGTTSRRAWRTPPLLAAISCAAGLATAGASLRLWKTSGQEPTSPAEVIVPQSQPSRFAVGGALLPFGPVNDVPAERSAEPRAASSASAGTDGGTRLPSIKQYAAEILLLEPARRSLSHGDYAGALASLGQHRRDFPNGQLRQEREALRVRALWGLGQKPAALAAANAFRKRYPRSALLSWLKDHVD